MDLFKELGGAIKPEELKEEFVLDFSQTSELTPIDIVSEITGLTYEEIRSCSEIIKL